MPFGLCNSAATFQRLMNGILKGLNWRSCIVYLDDIIFGKAFRQLLTRLDQVLQRLIGANLKAHLDKCKFAYTSVTYLGHQIGQSGVKPDPSKVTAITNLQKPTNVAELRSFLGSCTFYSRFIQDYSKIAAVLYDLTSPKREFIWSKDCENSFEMLKSKLTSAPLLRCPDYGRDFIVQTDASWPPLQPSFSKSLKTDHTRSPTPAASSIQPSSSTQ